MRFSDEFLDEIKGLTRVSDIVGRHVKLKRKGREFEALSPFTNEKTPSFFVHDEKGFYHCFSSGKHGDGIQFLMEVEGASFVEAVTTIAEMAGVPLPARDPVADRRFKQRLSLIDWMDKANSYFQKNMDKAAVEYMTRRGFDMATIRHFGVGFAPYSERGLINHLIQAGAKMPILEEIGLAIENKSGKHYDRFKNRVMFPILDQRGRPIAFGGRAMSTDAVAKYMNSPATTLFDKGSVVYNYANAKKALADPHNPDRGLIVVEGYMDVAALHQYGFPHSVAPMGTALTDRQLKMMWLCGPEPILCFDGDKAGQRAQERAINTALPMLAPGKSLRFAALPSKMDPDDVVMKRGAKAFRSILDHATSLVDALWAVEYAAEPVDTPEGKAGLKSRLMERMKAIKDPAVKELYMADILARFDKLYSRKRYEAQGMGDGIKQEIKRTANFDKRERRLIAAVFQWPELLETIDEAFFTFPFSTAEYGALQTEIMDEIRVREFIPRDFFLRLEDAALKRAVKDMGAVKHITQMDYGNTDDIDLIQSKWLEYYDSASAPEDIDSQINAAIAAGDTERLEQLKGKR